MTKSPTAMDRLVERCSSLDADGMRSVDYAEFITTLPDDEFQALLAMHDRYVRPTDTVDGLPVSGYQPQSPEAIASVNAVKEIEEHVLRLLDELKEDPELKVDQRWLAAGRTDIEKGFMAVNRSVFKPQRIELHQTATLSCGGFTGSARTEKVVPLFGGGPAVKGEAGWLLERADSPASSPLYYYPCSHGSQWIGESHRALRLSRELDAELLALALGVQVRVAEHQWG